MVTKKKEGKTGKIMGVAAIIGLVGYGIYKSQSVEAAPETITLPAVPDQSALLYEESLEALRKAQAALDESQALNATYDAALREHLLAPAESTAIIDPVVITTEYTPVVGEGTSQVPATITVYVDESEASKAAASAEAAAQKQRDELKRNWQDALNLANSTLPTLKANAEAGVRFFEQKQAKVESVLAEIEKHKNNLMQTNVAMNAFNTKVQEMGSFERFTQSFTLSLPSGYITYGGSIAAARDKIVNTFNGYMTQYNAAKTRLLTAKQERDAALSNAGDLIGMVNDGIERVLTITQGLAIITYVADVANRVDSLARSTREAIGMLQGRLTGVESALIYDEPLNIRMVRIDIPEPAPAPKVADDWLEKAQEEYRASMGITKAQVKSFAELADEVNIEMGGRYISGQLTPPPSWTGSVTGWSRYVQQVAKERFNNQ